MRQYENKKLFVFAPVSFCPTLCMTASDCLTFLSSLLNGLLPNWDLTALIRKLLDRFKIVVLQGYSLKRQDN